MRCFTDAELARGIAAIAAMPGGQAYALDYLLQVFIAAAGVRRDTTDDDATRSHPSADARLETTQRKGG